MLRRLEALELMHGHSNMHVTTMGNITSEITENIKGKEKEEEEEEEKGEEKANLELNVNAEVFVPLQGESKLIKNVEMENLVEKHVMELVEQQTKALERMQILGQKIDSLQEMEEPVIKKVVEMEKTKGTEKAAKTEKTEVPSDSVVMEMVERTVTGNPLDFLHEEDWHNLRAVSRDCLRMALVWMDKQMEEEASHGSDFDDEDYEDEGGVLGTSTSLYSQRML